MPRTTKKIFFKVYVVGKNSKNYTTISAFKDACAEIIPTSLHEIMIVDLVKNPKEAEKKKILGTPLIIKEFPLPEKRVIGELKDKSKAKSALDFLLEDY